MPYSAQSPSHLSLFFSKEVDAHAKRIGHIGLFFRRRPGRQVVRTSHGICRKEFLETFLRAILASLVAGVALGYAVTLHLLFGVYKVEGRQRGGFSATEAPLLLLQKALSQYCKKQNLNGLHVRILECGLVLEEHSGALTKSDPAIRHEPSQSVVDLFEALVGGTGRLRSDEWQSEASCKGGKKVVPLRCARGSETGGTGEGAQNGNGGDASTHLWSPLFVNRKGGVRARNVAFAGCFCGIADTRHKGRFGSALTADATRFCRGLHQVAVFQSEDGRDRGGRGAGSRSFRSGICRSQNTVGQILDTNVKCENS